MTQDIFHWEDVRRRLEIGVRKSIRHFSIVATSVVIIPRAICWGGFLTHSLVSPSVLFFERKLPLNRCKEFYEIIQFHYFSRNFGSFNLEKYCHLVEVKMGWFFFLGGGGVMYTFTDTSRFKLSCYVLCTLLRYYQNDFNGNKSFIQWWFSSIVITLRLLNYSWVIIWYLVILINQICELMTIMNGLF